jgi:hypothetical protein
MRAAYDTVALCAHRMTTCKPRARFTYASQITKAMHKLAAAERRLQEVQR